MMLREVSRRSTVLGPGSSGSRSAGSGRYDSVSKRLGGFPDAPRPRIGPAIPFSLLTDGRTPSPSPEIARPMDDRSGVEPAEAPTHDVHHPAVPFENPLHEQERGVVHRLAVPLVEPRR